jgi:histone H3/H4
MYDEIAAMVELMKEHGEERKEARSSLAALKTVQKAVAEYTFSDLRGLYYVYKDENGKFITDRYFYVLKD